MPDRKICRALVAVYDKTGIAEFARTLVDEFGIEIISTGGTAKHLKEAGIPVTLVEEVTGFPEMLDGRVKTLHPKIHAAILADRDNPEHMRQLAEQGIEPIDMVVVNLYPFEKTVADPNCTFEQAIEMIDIGGPCLLRAAAKNHKHVIVVCGTFWYERALELLRGQAGETAEAIRRRLATAVFGSTRRYDIAIMNYLFAKTYTIDVPPDAWEKLPVLAGGFWTKLFPCRYGENPHQQGAFYLCDVHAPPFRTADKESRESTSFNNAVDFDAALGLCAELARAGEALVPFVAPPGLKSGAPQAATPQDSAARTSDEPRTSVRAAARTRATIDPANVFTHPDSRAPAWLLTWTTYGSWLPGDDRGFVSRAPREDGAHAKRNEPGTPYDAGGGDLRESARQQMAGEPVRLTVDHARIVDAAFIEVATSHRIPLLAYSIMEDHVHVLCQSDLDGSALQKLFKGVSSRRLGQQFSLRGSPRWWTEGGSKRYIKKGEDLTGAVDYVCSQSRPLVVRSFERLGESGVPLMRETARTEVRGSSMEVRGSSVEGSSVCVFVKHTNACGAAVEVDPVEAYRKAYLGDPNAAMGGILAVNFAVEPAFAETVMETYQRWGKAAGAGGFFVEVWIAPSFEEKAVEIIREKKEWGKRVRLLAVGDMGRPLADDAMLYRSIAGGMLVQTPDLVGLNEDQWKVVTQRAPTDAEMADLRLAWLVCKHTKSNAITVCKDGMLIGNGAGQMSRVMSCRIATWLAKENGHADRLKGAAAASDAFFPFRDGPDILMDAGVTAVIQPGGSKRDEDTIAACNERDVALIFTGTRHFKH